MNLTRQSAVHFIGIGGVGMSALAQMACDLGMKVSGSDRGYGKSENEEIFNALEAQGIKIYPQDGSFMNSGRMVDAIIYSSAIEEDNPDFAASGNIPRLHRSEMLRELISLVSPRCSIAVTGSCGKTSVTAYLTETLLNAGLDCGCLAGGFCNAFRDGKNAGNYRGGNGDYFVFEADESDRSLLNYGADHAIILNLGTDHYDKPELVRVFGEFLNNVRVSAVLEYEVYQALKTAGKLPAHLKITVFTGEKKKAIDGGIELLKLEDYRTVDFTESIYYSGRRSRVDKEHDCSVIENMGANNILSIYGMKREDFRLEERFFGAEFSDGAKLLLPCNGRHTALNALAIYALCVNNLRLEREKILPALGIFHGVWRRSDYAGMTEEGALVYDDYSHNPEKLSSAMAWAGELASGKLLVVFQAHGFKPLGFMREALFDMLERDLRSQDVFIFLPPYYAGGTTSFKPTAEEVCEEYRAMSRHPERYRYFPDRESCAEYLHANAGAGDLILIAGARDNSLSFYARSLAKIR